ncbi:MAG: low temperature requirement protein A [Novosphingobium sp.]|uniref:low temperature requirement protein A n=1 Tax=Novosphingobium sp. TaxID=1874826 RepID=UPI0032B9B619
MSFLAAAPDTQRPRVGIGAAVAAAERQARRSLLRNHGGGHAPVSYLELFVDLVFVFAITQLSHFLKVQLNLTGLLEAVVLFLAIWWAWMYTTWATNWANPERIEIRLMLLAIMLLSLVMAVALPHAFAQHAGLFAGCYLALQIGRSAFMAVAMERESPRNGRNMQRIAIWFTASGLFWIIGVLRGDHERLGWWALAMTIEYLGPAAMFWVPRLGRSKGSDWDISGSHMAERCALFVIIALGEGIIITGAAFAQLALEATRSFAFLIAFLSSVLMWWLYFDLGAERGSQHIRNHAEPGRVARNAYTYLHMPIVLGIVIAAVGDALLLQQPDGPATVQLIAVQTGGAILFLTGLGLFKRYSNTMGNFPMSHVIAMVLFGFLGMSASYDPMAALQFGALGAAIFLLAAIWEWVSYHGGWVERAERLGLNMPARIKARAERRRADVEARRG